MATLEKECQARVGTTVGGKWKLEKLLGIGGMAAVYVGRHKIGRRDAIKVLHREIAEDEANRTRFEREARAVNEFNHPGAVAISDMGTTDDGLPFLVMELLEGETMQQRAQRQGGLEEDNLLDIVDAVLDVLADAHRHDIIHRDIKLENIFLTKKGTTKVLDFGVARMSAGPAITADGMRLGTTAYMPPEQVKGKDIDQRADLFAVGATMYRVLAKRRLHEATTQGELVAKMATESAPPLSDVAPKIDPRLASIVDCAVAFSRDDRYPDAETMQKDIAAYRAGEEPPFAFERVALTRPEGAGMPETKADGPAALGQKVGASPMAESVSGNEDDAPSRTSIRDSEAAETPHADTPHVETPHVETPPPDAQRERTAPVEVAITNNETPKLEAGQTDIEETMKVLSSPDWLNRARELANSKPSSTLPSAGTDAPPPPATSMRWTAVATVVLLLAGAVLAYLVVRGPQ